MVEMTWICEYCGRENHQSDRVALKEPACLRCDHRRGSRMESVAKLETKIAELMKWDRAYTDKIKRLEAVNISLWDEIAANATEHDNLLDERKENLLDLIKSREKLQALKDLDPESRLITNDQRMLIEGDHDTRI